jgi:hypothetical protein
VESTLKLCLLNKKYEIHFNSLFYIYIMLCFLVGLVCVIFIFLGNKTKFISRYKNPNRLTIAYDFDDCLKNVNTKSAVNPVVNQMINDHQRGDKVVIITARGKAGVPEIECFLDKYNLKSKIPIYTTGDNISREKTSTIKELGVDVFYDDQPGFLDHVHRYAPHVMLFQTSPNEEPIIRPYKRRRVASE